MTRFMLRVLVVAFVCLSVGVSSAQDALRPITFFITFIPNIQFSPVYVAIEKGYFADAGIEIIIEHGDEPDGVNLIAAGERQFGLISGEQAIAARANGRPVVFVYEWFQKYPVGIVTSDDIATVNDLAGLRVGIPGLFGASYTGVNALLAANTMTQQDIQLESIGFNAPDVYCVGRVEASVIYVNNEPLQIASRVAAGECGNVTGIKVFNVSDSADIVSNGILTNEQTIAEEPELVQAFVEAFHRGLTDVLLNPAEAYLLSASYIEGLPLSDDLRIRLTEEASARAAEIAANAVPPTSADRISATQSLLERLQADFDDAALVQIRVLSATADLWETERLGFSDRVAWENTQDTLISMAVIDAPIDLDGVYTNDFVP